MEPRVDLITLGVGDLDAARAFYADGLGWPVILDVPGEVVFLQAGHGLALGLFGADALAADVGVSPAPTGPGALSLAQILATEDDVREAARRAVAAGGSVLKEPQRAAFGGFHAYVADPFGFRWEIATNPGWTVDLDGTVRLRPIAEPG